MTNRHAYPLFLALLCAPGALVAAGCEGDDGDGGTTTTTTTTTATTTTGQGGGGGGGAGGSGGGGGAGGSMMAMDVEVSFAGRVGAQAFDCASTYTGLGTAATDVTITDFRFYVHDVRLLTAEGAEVPVTLTQDGLWQYQTLALIDFENGAGSCANGTAETNAAVRGTAPAGEYTGVAFRLGVPADMNHQDVAVAPSPLNLSAMFWTWNSGYKFLRVDSVPAGAPEAFNLHLGSTGCTGDPIIGEQVTCARPNRAEITLTGFDPLTTPVLVDYAAAIAGSDLAAADGGGAPGCMSGPTDPECAAVFERLGLSLVDGTTVAGQQLFRVE